MDRIKKIKVLLGMVKQQFATAKLIDGSEISFDALEINREVYNSEGNPLAEGEYTLEDGTKITVDVNGVIKEIEKADGETEKEEVVTEMAEEEPKGDEGNEEPKPEEPKGDEGNEVIVVKIDGVGEVTLANDGKVYYDADGNKIEGEYKDVDNKYSVVIKGGKVVAWKPLEQPATEEITEIYVLNADGKKVRVPLKEGYILKIGDGEYTDIEGEYIVTIKEGKVAGWKSTKAPEVPEPNVKPESKPVTADLEARFTELENKVDELYNLILKLTEEQREKEVRIEEIKEEFASIKANPSASPVFVSEPQKDAPLSRVQRLKDLKSRK
jgi:hypothetical protein